MVWVSAGLLFIILAMVPSLSGTRHRRVVGGRLVRKGRYPFLVTLWYMKENPFTKNTKMHHLCGGSLIDSSWVLTAAHCFEDKYVPGSEVKESWKVIVGKHNQLTDEDTNQIRAIEEIHIYHGWNSTTLLGDAALLKLNQSIDLTAEGVGTIKPDTDSTCAVPGADCYVVGWGQVIERPYGYGMYVPVMAPMPLVDTQTCIDAFSPQNTKRTGHTYTIDHTNICAGYVGGGVDACSGDSGGPLVCKCSSQDVVSGIVSNGLGCARKNFYGIYTRVSILQDWIKEVRKREEEEEEESRIWERIKNFFEGLTS